MTIPLKLEYHTPLREASDDDDDDLIEEVISALESLKPLTFVRLLVVLKFSPPKLLGGRELESLEIVFRLILVNHTKVVGGGVGS